MIRCCKVYILFDWFLFVAYFYGQGQILLQQYVPQKIRRPDMCYSLHIQRSIVIHDYRLFDRMV